MSSRLSILFVCLLLAASCCPCRHLPTHTETTAKDSVAVHNHNSHSVVDSTSVRDSTIHAPLPVENSQNILPAIVPSHLETSLAESDAYVDSLGLHHTLRNKDTTLDVHVPVTEHYHHEQHDQQTDTTVHHSSDKKETVPEYIDKPLTSWQRFRIKSFWWLILLVAIGFRREMFALVKKII